MKMRDYIALRRSRLYSRLGECCGTCGAHWYTCQCRASPYHGECTENHEHCDEYHELRIEMPGPDTKD